MEAKKVIILGNSLPHIKLIELLKSLSYNIILIDYNENSPAKDLVDEHVVESALDKDKVLEIAKVNNVSLVLSLSVDQAIPVACYVSEKLGLPNFYSFETALKVTHKALMKDVLIRSGINTTKYVIVNSDNNKDLITKNLKFPLMVKPVDATGSIGIEKVNNISKLQSAIENALKISRDKQAIVEEFFEGQDISVDCYVDNNEVHILLLRKQYKINSNIEAGRQSIGSVVLKDSNSVLYNEIQNTANKVAKSFNLKNTPLLLQILVKDNNVNVVEIAARIGGGTHVDNIKSNTNFDIIYASLMSILNKDINIKYNHPNKFRCTHFLYANRGIFNKVVGLEKLKEEGMIENFYILKPSHSVIEEKITSKNRIAAFLVSSDSELELFNKILKIFESIDIIDVNGASIFNRQLTIK